MAVYIGNTADCGKRFEELADPETSILDGVDAVERAFIKTLSI